MMDGDRARGRLFAALPLLGLLTLSACAAPDAEALWAESAHADEEARAFRSWDEREPPEISESCAKCHSTHGYLDFLGADGSEAGVVSHPAPIGTTVECEACHNEASDAKTHAEMPSGLVLHDLGAETDCMECHQGRASGAQVRETLGERAPDEVDAELAFPGLHNAAAGPTQHGREAGGGYEYPDRDYAGRYDHAADFRSCAQCHDPHALRIEPERCAACHPGVRTEEDLRDIRMSGVDHDGDQDVQEGIAAEIEDLRGLLLQRMLLYAATTEGVAPPTYTDGRPYWLDPEGEAYGTWTPRLMRAAFNYHYTAMEPGGYAHNPAYQLQLLHDSMADLGTDERFLTRAGEE